VRQSRGSIDTRTLGLDGTFSTEEFDEAVQTARDERINSTSRYLLGMPLLTDYLKEGLKQLGISSEDAESEVV
jgi:Protein of unknown function (DUF3775)